MVHFKRRIGAKADVSELEYIIALHQTCMPATRDNATVSSLDVMRMLISRYGLRISHKKAVEVVRSLGGGDDRTPMENDATSPNKRPKQGINFFRRRRSLEANGLEGSDDDGSDERDSSVDADDFEVSGESYSSAQSNEEDKDGTASESTAKFKDSLQYESEMGVISENILHDAEKGEEDSESNDGLSDSDDSSEDDDDEDDEEDDDEDDEEEDDDEDDDEEVEGGPDDHEDVPEEYLDLVQLLSVLLIPSFARAADEQKHGLPDPPLIPAPAGSFIFHPLQHLGWIVKRMRGRRLHARRLRYRSNPPDLLTTRARDILMQGIQQEPVVNEELVEALLLKYGEYDRASNKELIRKMVEVADSYSGRFDDEAFVNAISSDLNEWEVASEDRLSTLFYDVFGTSNPSNIDRVSAEPARRGIFDSGVVNSSRTLDPLYDEVERSPPKDCVRQTFAVISDACVETRKLIVWHCLRVYKQCASFFSCCCACCCCCDQSKSPFKTEKYNIDLVLDNHSSLWVTVAIWVFFMNSVILYGAMLLGIEMPGGGLQCPPNDFGCLVMKYIVVWAAFAMILSFFGLIMILPTSYGNHPYSRHIVRQFFAIIVTLAYSIGPFVIVNRYQAELMQSNADANWIERIVEQVESIRRRVTQTLSSGGAVNMMAHHFFDDLQLGVLITGFVLSFLFLVQVLCDGIRWFGHVLEKADLGHMLVFKSLIAPSYVRAETRLKRAASHKINVMLANASELHHVDQFAVLEKPRRVSTAMTHDRTIRNYTLRGQRVVPAGGWAWTWLRIINGRLLDEEGLWINSRLFVFQAAQVILGGAFSAVLYASVEAVAKKAEAARIDIRPDFPQWLQDMFPTREMVTTSLYPACGIAVFVMALLILLYIPSAVSTVLQYRCQILPSLGSPYFNKYKAAVDTVYMNSANAVYGLLGSGGLFFVFFGALIFLFKWPPTRDTMYELLAYFLGLTITVCLKMAVTMSCRASQYRSFYRIRPRCASFSSLALECWYIGLGGSVLIGRVTQFLLAACFWVGRIDVQFLTADVKLLGYSFDYVPSYFVKDLLVHEAHRHPFLERLAQMYLMKLRYKNFGSSAGAAWRQLCVLAMFPWLYKYRVYDEERHAQAVLELQKRRARRQEEEERRRKVLGASTVEAFSAAAADKSERVEAGVRVVESNVVHGLAKATGLVRRASATVLGRGVSGRNGIRFQDQTSTCYFDASPGEIDSRSKTSAVADSMRTDEFVDALA